MDAVFLALKLFSTRSLIIAAILLVLSIVGDHVKKEEKRKELRNDIRRAIEEEDLEE
jgi:hypothetical protein